MTTRNDVRKALCDSHRRTAEAVALAARSEPLIFRHALDLCWEDPYPISMRAARVIQFCCEANPEMLYPFLDEVMEKFPDSRIEGVRRGFLKVFSENMDLHLLKETGKLLNICFNCLLDVSQPYAIRIYAMEVIFRFCHLEPELIPELRSTLEFILPEAPPSIQSRGRRILKKLH